MAFALLIFYALLTSIGEQTGFNWAYLISALAVTSLILAIVMRASQQIKWYSED